MAEGVISENTHGKSRKADAHIARLRANRNLNTIVVGHSHLGDAGCERLFDWLTAGDHNSEGTAGESRAALDEETIQDGYLTEFQFPRSMATLELNDVGMGDIGFTALVRWLESVKERAKAFPVNLSGGEEPLRKLNLRYNPIHGTADLAQAFISSLTLSTSTPTSTISSLVLSNIPLSAEFRQILLSSLHLLPSLRQLYLSITGLTRSDAKLLAKYFGHPEGRCKLVEFYANANTMQYGGVKEIVKAMKNCWSLERVDMYANGFVGGDAADRNEEDEDPDKDEDDLEREAKSLPGITLLQPPIASSTGSACGWPGLEVLLKNIMTRNTFLKRQTAEQALQLLKYSRILLRPEAPCPTASSPQTQRSGDCTGASRPSTTPPTPTTALPHRSFRSLPTEIQLAILSSLAPILSSVQRIRIFEHAADRRTLPKLVLCLPSRSLSGSSRSHCVPDPGSLAFSGGIISQGKKVGQLGRVPEANPGQHQTYAGGACMGSNAVVCQSRTHRQNFLDSVGCDLYDPAE
ncbi:unnamed protein product [Cyclocybe aegerita]|uniref:RNI-like protein n=1 Tax=Cyclocybe aegerita TaxID=1973307 RepID=A0A8S0XW30_CYCAE|nr:unnamed protein product [Cyclocybe aegerita]